MPILALCGEETRAEGHDTEMRDFFFFVYQRKISLWLHKHFKTKLGWSKTGDENEVCPARVFLEQKSKMTF